MEWDTQKKIEYTTRRDTHGSRHAQNRIYIRREKIARGDKYGRGHMEENIYREGYTRRRKSLEGDTRR